MTKTIVALLLGVAALLGAHASVNPCLSLRHVIHHAKNLTSLPWHFVENVKHHHNCGDKFFCKVHKILEPRESFRNGSGVVLVRNLRQLNSHVNCTQLLENVAPASANITLSGLMDDLVTCSQRRIWQLPSNVCSPHKPAVKEEST